MTTKKPRTVLYRRKRENKTNYTKRLRILSSKKSRLAVRFSNQKIYAQIIDFTTKGDKVLVGMDSSKLKEFGWNYSYKNIPAAYLTGLLFGKKVLETGKKEAIFDIGKKYPSYKGKIYAFLKGVIDSGMDIPHGTEEIFPSEERLSGKHIKEYAAKAGEKFTKYLKNNAQAVKISEIFEQVKQKIKG